MAGKSNRIYAIAVIDSQYLRDYKLVRLDGDESPPDFDKILKLWNKSTPTLVPIRPRICRITGKKVFGVRLPGLSKWKTMRGCEKALSCILSTPRAMDILRDRLKRLHPSYGGQVQFQLMPVDITDLWNDSIVSQISQATLSHEKRVKGLREKLVN